MLRASLRYPWSGQGDGVRREGVREGKDMCLLVRMCVCARMYERERVRTSAATRERC